MTHAPPSDAPITLRALMDAQAGAPLPTDDALALLLPLFDAVAALHAQGLVAVLDPGAIVVRDGHRLALSQPQGQPRMLALDALQRVQPSLHSTLNIVGQLRHGHDAAGNVQIGDAEVQADADALPLRPVYLPRFGSWEIALGHHDETTDVFRLGLLLAALACGLDFDAMDDVESFAAHRRNLFELNPRLHPVVAAVIVEMTALNRHERATGLDGPRTRLRTWREQPEVLDVERALAGGTDVPSRRVAVLGHLRNRLFDLSRRNRLLHFRPTAASINLTEASVPLVLQLDSIRPEHLCTWSGAFAEQMTAGRALDLQRWLRFDDQPFLPAALDRLIQDTRRDRAEYGFSNLRLVLAFLRWHNLKECPDERIISPLLWLPVELVRRKGVRDQYVLQATGNEAEFNPVLRHQLQQLYAIRLPDSVDLSTTGIDAVHADLLTQIRRSEPAVELRLLQKPQIRLVRQKAMQRLAQYQRRRTGTRVARDAAAALPDYSYARGDYRPLGQALFERWIRPSPLPQRFEAGAAPVAGPRSAHMAAQAAEAGERLGFALEEPEGHRYAWDVDLAQVSLANFNYRKMSLVRDYTQLIEQPHDNPAFDRVFSIEPRAIDPHPADPLPPDRQWNVVAADATQNAAVGLARSGRSFIIQGPPGTGKSQTITNLIADYAGQGKRVLFVCEKRAALDVVYHRLKQSGLDTLCCLIHDSQADKKAFIGDLKDCYERWMAQPHDGDALARQRSQLLDLAMAQQHGIDTFEQAMARTDPALGTSVRALVRRIAELPPAPALDAAMRERLPTLAEWDDQGDLALQLHAQMQRRFGARSLAAHPFAALGDRLVMDEHAYAQARQVIEDCERQLQHLADASERGTTLAAMPHTPAQASTIALAARWLLDHGLASHLDVLDAESEATRMLARIREQWQQREAALRKAADATTHWIDPLDATDARTALQQAQALEPSLLRWLQPAWWRLRSTIHARYRFSAHAVQPAIADVLQTLAAEHAARDAVAALDSEVRERFGAASAPAFIAAVADLQQQLAASQAMPALVQHLRAGAEPVAAALREADLIAPLQALSAHLDGALDVPADASLERIEEVVRDLRESLDDLPDLLPLLRAVQAAAPASRFVLRHLDLPPADMAAVVADEALRRLERASPEFARFDSAALAEAVRALAQARQQLLGLNARTIQATRHRQFAEHVRTSTLSATQLDAAGKAFKKQYATGRRELEHEFGKSMRHRSIRDLSDDETGTVVNDLKPIWLMSPLSVSDTLPLQADLFDVVIFDEASQIPTEEAVPALSRARQIVVVGDEMQLPPTSFFSAVGDDGEELVLEDDGERIAINLDSDSLLNQAARNLPATLLAWHYRSRHEALISFSNAAFYAGRLVTIPDRSIERASAPARPRRSDDPDAGARALAALLERPISFHRIADGVYADRRNAAEARYIAELVRALLAAQNGQSIGIVAFSEAQQAEIEAALDTLAAADPAFSLQLEREYVREDQDQFNGLFVKNLENVQGDERDIILLSICYAPGPDGRMLMNFGPINQRGGEKRLNVIFSRARHRMAVVSTIHAEAITNVHNDGAAALRAFLQFAQASADGDAARAQHVLGALNAGARDVFARQPGQDSIRDALAQALRERGHLVHAHVGRSQFRCDLAIVDPDAGDYRLAILLDAPGERIDDAGERYVFRPGILGSFGWRTVDVSGRDWLRDPRRVIGRIESVLAGEDACAPHAGLSLPAIASATDLPADPAASPDPCEPAAAGAADAVRRLRFEQGDSRKFWQASRSGSELAVRYGRLGTQGQTNLKVFDSAERAQREMDKLVAEKLRKGYADDA